MADKPMSPEEMGVEAARRTIDQVRKALEDAGATLEFRVRRLKELAEYKGKKPFSYEGRIVYSKALDFPDVQLKAIHEMNLMDGSHAPAKAEFSGPGGGAIRFSNLERANRLRYLIEKAQGIVAEAGKAKEQ